MRKRLKKHFIPHSENDYKPHFSRGKTAAFLAISAIVFFGIFWTFQTVVKKPSEFLASVISSVLIDVTNDNRLASNLTPLKVSPTLTRAAQSKANDMAEKGYFAHNSPDGKNPWYWFGESNYNFAYAGENLAVNFSDSEEVVEAWMNSAGHRANIMNNKFSEIGIAMAPGMYKGRDTIFIVQLFGHPAIAVQTSTAAENVPAGVSSATNTPAVAGADTKTKLEVIAENDYFIAVENTGYTEAPSVAAVSYQAESDTFEKSLTSPKKILRMVYMIMGGLILLALLLMSIIEPKRFHKKGALNLILVLLLIVTLCILSVEAFPATVVN